MVDVQGVSGLTYGIGSFHAVLPSDAFISVSFVCVQCGDLIDDPLSVTTVECLTFFAGSSPLGRVHPEMHFTDAFKSR